MGLRWLGESGARGVLVLALLTGPVPLAVASFLWGSPSWSMWVLLAFSSNSQSGYTYWVSSQERALRMTSGTEK